MLFSDKRLMRILSLAREANLPNWYIGAGLIRNYVWDFLHGWPQRTPIRDVDFIYYSPDAIDEVRVRAMLAKKMPKIDWDLKNSAFVHAWYANKGIVRPALKSSEEDIDGWPETASCVGVRLQADDELLIYVPYEVDDLLNMVFRRNKNNQYSVNEEVFRKRVIDKKIKERWPKVKIIYD